MASISRTVATAGNDRALVDVTLIGDELAELVLATNEEIKNLFPLVELVTNSEIMSGLDETVEQLRDGLINNDPGEIGIAACALAALAYVLADHGSR